MLEFRYLVKTRTQLSKTFLVVLVAVSFQVGITIKLRGRQYSSKGCEFPSEWTGTWFQKGVHPLIQIEKDVFSFKGKCHESKANFYYIEDSKEDCFRCVLILQKHPNVLQYRETYCDDYSPLTEACASLSADVSLYSLFRVNADPVPCGIRGPFSFSYSRGGRNECSYPVSTIDSCTDEAKLLFRFQACAEVPATESSVEELSCLALWKEGSIHYLVGKMTNRKQHNPSYQDDNAYRCFVFEHLSDKDEIQMSQNADATCDGLVSPLEGSRTMKLKKKSPAVSRCRFPKWIAGSFRWKTLEGHRIFDFSQTNSSFEIIDHRTNRVTKFICTAEVDSEENTNTVISHGTEECESGFVCIKFFKRHKYIVELHMGSFSRSPHEACQNAFSQQTEDNFITLVAPTMDSQACPNLTGTEGLGVQLGKFSSPSSANVICGESLWTAFGCQFLDTLRFLVTCASYTDVKSFYCHGHWEERGRTYLITTLKDTEQKYCFVYKSGESLTHVSGVLGACHRTVEPGITGNFTFNVTAAGECDDGLRSQAPMFHTWGVQQTLIQAMYVSSVYTFHSIR